MAVPTTFPDVQAEVERSVRAGDVGTAARLVERLNEKARATRSREMDALAWFGKAALEAGQRDFAAAEQSLLVAIKVGRELLKQDVDALGHCARSLGFVYARMNRPEPAAEMFLLARSVFLKLQPHLASEVVRFAASCNIALQLPEVALALVHQELGPPGSASAEPRTPDALELLLVRARAYDEQRKPVQALKTLAQATRLLQPSEQSRSVVARAWMRIAQTWADCGDLVAAGLALDCALFVDGGDGRDSRPVGALRSALGIGRVESIGTRTFQVQHAASDIVAFASPAHGLFVERCGGLGAGDQVGAERRPEGGWSLRPLAKARLGSLRETSRYHPMEGVPAGVPMLIGPAFGTAFVRGETIWLDDGLSEPGEGRVRGVEAGKLAFDWTRLLGTRNALGDVRQGRERMRASIWGAVGAVAPLAVGDEQLQLLLNRA